MMPTASSHEPSTRPEFAIPNETENSLVIQKQEVVVDGGGITASADPDGGDETPTDYDARGKGRVAVDDGEEIDGGKDSGVAKGSNPSHSEESKPTNNGEARKPFSPRVATKENTRQPQRPQQQQRRQERQQQQRNNQNFKTVTIAIDNVASSVVSVVDPWVPRIRNNDEYLRRGLDLSPWARTTDPSNDEEDADDEEDTTPSDVGGEISIAGGGGIEIYKHRISPLVGDVGAVRLADALVHNARLLYLNLSRNDIGAEGGTALARSLYSLSIEGGRSGGGGANVVDRNVFRSRTALRTLNLSHNRLGDKGAVAFARALCHNASITELRLSDNGIPLEGILALLVGLRSNRTLKRLGLGDNVERELTPKEATRLARGVGAALERGINDEGGTLEALEMHNCARLPPPIVDDEGGDTAAYKDNFDSLSTEDALRLKRSIYGNTGATTSVSSSGGPPDEGRTGLLRNHRFRTLTFPRGSGGYVWGGDACGNASAVRELRRTLRFNSFYRPILQLHDVLESPLARAEASLGVPARIPPRLRRDALSGALAALLPSSIAADPVTDSQSPSSSQNRRASSSAAASTKASSGVEYKVMPRVLAFACNECALDTVWNLIRYRPDVLCCVGPGGKAHVVVCAPCGSLGWGDGGCCIS